MDLNMPVMDGKEAAKLILEKVKKDQIIHASSKQKLKIPYSQVSNDDIKISNPSNLRQD